MPIQVSILEGEGDLIATFWENNTPSYSFLCGQEGAIGTPDNKKESNRLFS